MKYRKHTTRDRGFVECEGRRIYLPGPYRSEQSLAAYREIVHAHRAPADFFVAPGVVLVSHLVEQFLVRTKGDADEKRSEWANFKYAARFLLRYHYLPAASFGPLKLLELRDAMAEMGRAREYINGTIRRIKAIFSWGVSQEMISPDVYAALSHVPGLRMGKSRAKERPKPPPVPWKHVEPVLKHLSPTVRAMVLMQWFTGVRPQSVCWAAGEQIDRKRNPWEWRPKHKTQGLGKSLVVFIGPQCQKVIRPFLRPGFLFRPLNDHGTRSKGHGEHYKTGTYYRAVRRAIERANEGRKRPIPRWTPNQIRHTKGTDVRADYGLEAAQAVLGHARMDMTEHYARQQLDLARKVAIETG